MTGNGLTCGSTQCGKYTGTFHVPTFSVSDSGGLGGKGTAAPLQLVRNAHASKAAHKAPPDGTMLPEYTYEVAEKGCGDSEKVNGGNLHYNGGGSSGLF